MQSCNTLSGCTHLPGLISITSTTLSLSRTSCVVQGRSRATRRVSSLTARSSCAKSDNVSLGKAQHIDSHSVRCSKRDRALRFGVVCNAAASDVAVTAKELQLVPLLRRIGQELGLLVRKAFVSALALAGVAAFANWAGKRFEALKELWREWFLRHIMPFMFKMSKLTLEQELRLAPEGKGIMNHFKQPSNPWVAPYLKGISTMKGAEELIPLLAKLELPLDARDKNGCTALHSAALAGTVEAVAALVNCGADVNARDRLGATPLLMAVAENDVKKVEELLRGGADTEAQTDGGANALFLTILRSPGVDMLETLLSWGANAQILVNKNSLLLHTIMQGAFDKLKCLLKHGLNPNVLEHVIVSSGPDLTTATKVSYMTPLHFAVRHGKVEAVSALIEGGAELDCLDDTGMSPLGAAVLAGDARLVEVLLEKGANPEFCSADGESPCMLAITSGQEEILGILLIADADPGMSYSGPMAGRPLLIEAVIRSSPAMVACLLEAGADPNISVNHEGMGLSPLVLAICGMKFNSELAGVPVEQFQKLHATTESILGAVFDNTSQRKGAQHVHPEALAQRKQFVAATKDILELLIDCEADLYFRASDGSMLLHHAASIRHDPEAEVVRVLLEREAPGVNATTEDLRTPLHVAASVGNLEACKALVEYGADVLAEDICGLAPVFWALFAGHKECAIFLRQRMG